jgi:alkanesulfonate monooxygenase SsuD/methylene tetrahydromethanopterin reductase-like flavin-dependent oxidoreductase (luciferase family)
LKFGVYLPIARDFADPAVLVALAVQAEHADWDGFFVWDHLSLAPRGEPWPLADPWIVLAAVAAWTQRIRLGPLVTPLARRRPAKVARETVTLDRLSGGRLVLGVGSGGADRSDFAALGEDPDARVRAQKLDEALEVVTGLWRGEPFTFRGAHFRIEETTFLPRPVQEPRVPVWVAGAWPRRAPARRAARWDGMFPISENWPRERLTPDDYRAIREFIGRDDFELVFTTTWGHEGEPADVPAYAEAGVTWWLQEAQTAEEAERRIAAGPPRP